MGLLRVTRRPAPFVLVASGHGSLIVNRHDYQMVDENRGYGVGFQILATGYFDPAEVGLALRLLDLRRQHFGDGVVAVDCGANVGVHTVEWAAHMYGWGEVLAVEAQERLYYALAGNIALNNLFNARAVHAAVGASDGSLDIPVLDYNRPSSFGSFELKPRANREGIGQAVDFTRGKRQAVRLMALDSLRLPRVDLIKIDVEGMELEAIAGASTLIRSCRPLLLVETIKVDEGMLTAELSGRGYRLFPLGINVLAVHELDPCGKEVENLIARRTA